MKYSLALLAVSVPAMTVSFTDAAVMRSAQPFIGVTHHQYIQTYNDTDASTRFIREIVVNTMEIDLTAPGIQVLMQPKNTIAVTTPDSALSQNPGLGSTVTAEYRRQTTRSFVNSVGAQIGVNLDFYSTVIPGVNNPQVSYPSGPNGEYFADGIYAGASNGTITSRNNGFESIFNVSADNIARMLTAAGANTTTTQEGVPLYNAQGGNQRLLKSGKNVTPQDDSYTTTVNPHTALGVSQDGHRIYLMVVDGRQTDYADGMRTDEMADLLHYYGAWDAINIDGGGSSTMVMDDTNDAAQNARVVNSPSDGSSGQTPGSERMIANSMAIYAQWNPNYVALSTVARPPAPVANRILPIQKTFDSFENSSFNGGFGHFPSGTSPYGLGAFGAGSNRGINITSSSVSVDSTTAHTGGNSLKVTIVSSNSGNNGMKLRLLSGGNSPSYNVYDDVTLEPVITGATNDDYAMGKTGYIGYYLKLNAGSAALYASILLDDGSRTSSGLERATFQQVIADGQWHLYQWNLGDATKWENFSGGNGTIDGPNAFIDALYFSSAASTSSGGFWSGVFWIDNVTYNPDGPIMESGLSYETLSGYSSSNALGQDTTLTPEPASLLMLAVGGLALAARRR